MGDPINKTGSEQDSVRKLFQQAEAKMPEPSAFLVTRVMAELRGRQHGQGRLRLWQTISAAALFTLVGVITVRAFSPSTRTGTPVVARVGIQQLKQEQIEHAGLEVPGEVLSKGQPDARPQAKTKPSSRKSKHAKKKKRKSQAPLPHNQ